MKKISVLLSLIAVVGLAHADLRSDIIAANKRLEKAAMAKDIKAAETIMKETMTSNFKYMQDGKAQDLKTFMGNYTASIAMTDKVTSHSTRIISLKETGNKATAELEKKMTGTLKMPDKKPHTMDWTGVFTEEYRKVGGKWKTAVMTAGKQKFLMDGKPAKM